MARPAIRLLRHRALARSAERGFASRDGYRSTLRRAHRSGTRLARERARLMAILPWFRNGNAGGVPPKQDEPITIELGFGSGWRRSTIPAEARRVSSSGYFWVGPARGSLDPSSPKRSRCSSSAHNLPLPSPAMMTINPRTRRSHYPRPSFCLLPRCLP